MIYIKTLKEKAEAYKKTLDNKSGKQHIEEIRVWQKQAVDEFVNRIAEEYETSRPKY